MSAAHVDLGKYDGRDITVASIVIPGAGGGLREALAVAPILLHTGDEVTIALKCTVEDINHKIIKDKSGEDTGNYERVAKLVPSLGLIIDGPTLDKAFKAQQIKVEEAAGVQRIPGVDD